MSKTRSGSRVYVGKEEEAPSGREVFRDEDGELYYTADTDEKAGVSLRNLKAGDIIQDLQGNKLEVIPPSRGQNQGQELTFRDSTGQEAIQADILNGPGKKTIPVESLSQYEFADANPGGQRTISFSDTKKVFVGSKEEAPDEKSVRETEDGDLYYEVKSEAVSEAFREEYPDDLESDTPGTTDKGDTRWDRRDILNKPFADFENMDECMEEHSDKEDPGAYCAQIHYETTGEWPSEKMEKVDREDIEEGVSLVGPQGESWVVDDVTGDTVTMRVLATRNQREYSVAAVENSWRKRPMKTSEKTVKEANLPDTPETYNILGEFETVVDEAERLEDDVRSEVDNLGDLETGFEELYDAYERFENGNLQGAEIAMAQANGRIGTGISQLSGDIPAGTMSELDRFERNFTQIRRNLYEYIDQVSKGGPSDLGGAGTGHGMTDVRPGAGGSARASCGHGTPNSASNPSDWAEPESITPQDVGERVIVQFEYDGELYTERGEVMDNGSVALEDGGGVMDPYNLEAVRFMKSDTEEQSERDTMKVYITEESEAPSGQTVKEDENEEMYYEVGETEKLDPADVEMRLRDIHPRRMAAGIFDDLVRYMGGGINTSDPELDRELREQILVEINADIHDIENAGMNRLFEDKVDMVKEEVRKLARQQGVLERAEKSGDTEKEFVEEVLCPLCGTSMFTVDWDDPSSMENGANCPNGDGWIYTEIQGEDFIVGVAPTTY